MRTIRRNWVKFAGAITLTCLAACVIYTCISAWGQTLPALDIVMTNSNSSVFLTVTNGTNTGKYQIYWTEFLSDAPAWVLVTNGGTGVTNFVIDIGDDTSGFFEARNNTNAGQFVLNLTILAPASGANVQ